MHSSNLNTIGEFAIANLTFSQSIEIDINSITASAGNDRLIGTIRNDRLLGLAGNDTLSGLAGNDTLNGGVGRDRTIGGTGNDLHIVDSLSDVVFEAANQGNDTIVSTVSRTLSLNLENLTLGGTANLNGIGNNLSNRLVGNRGNNDLSGRLGNDLLAGGAGNDTLNGGVGSDRANGGLGDDVYFVNSIRDAVIEAPNQGLDTVSSSISYTLRANVENLALLGTANLRGVGNGQNNFLFGNSGNNIVNGVTGNDILAGDSGNDTLIGGTGNDFLAGNLGRDILTGGAGTDGFAFTSPNEGGDRIFDFTRNIDFIGISASGFGGGLRANTALAPTQFVLGVAARDVNDRFIYNRINSTLFFDRDGTGAIAQVQIATFNPGLALTNTAILVV